MKYLLDTKVVSELRKNPQRRNGQVDQWARGLVLSDSYLSVITVLELRVGIGNKRRRDPAQASALEDWLNNSLLPAYSRRVLAVDDQVIEVAAQLHVPDRHPAHDALIAATALAHGLTLVTRNEVDFAPMGLQLVNPWRQ